MRLEIIRLDKASVRESCFWFDVRGKGEWKKGSNRGVSNLETELF